MGFFSAFLLIVMTVILLQEIKAEFRANKIKQFPPLGVFAVAGCGADLLINIALTVLGYLPGHLHAFYLEWVYYERKEQTAAGRLMERPAPGIFSERIQGTSYGTIGDHA